MSTEPVPGTSSRTFRSGWWRRASCVLLVLASLAALGCRQDMHDQPRYEALEASTFFGDGQASRHPVEGTVARGHLRSDGVFETGKSDGEFVSYLPMEVDAEVLQRGRERFDIFCSPCHGRLGEGQGMVVRRGFKRPNSFHRDPLKSQPVGYYFDAMTNGFGQMPSYASQIPARDRWSIAAYIRALQLSRGARVSELPLEDREALQAPDEGAGTSANPPADDSGH
ncbi:MAG: cytochrome c [Thermoanaerobaculia bacterium]|nr:cytochrome c [Thermoanaerobaculia bacterium]